MSIIYQDVIVLGAERGWQQRALTHNISWVYCKKQQGKKEAAAHGGGEF
jgi:hypothetical protein